MFTLFDCVTRINQTLNYPSIEYIDMSHFFDQAISELNTSFKIGLPLVSQMVDENRLNITELPNVMLLDNVGIINSIDYIPNEDTEGAEGLHFSTKNYKFYKYDFSEELWKEYDTYYGIHIDDSGKRTTYTTMVLPTASAAIWTPVVEERANDFDLTDYIPADWIILFLIPYVCFKVSVRDGNNGALYNEEYTQGFQQLQTSYDVPNFVTLKDVAHLPAYRSVVKAKLNSLNETIPTRAVYDTMKIGNAIRPTYGGFHMRGGWGL